MDHLLRGGKIEIFLKNIQRNIYGYLFTIHFEQFDALNHFIRQKVFGDPIHFSSVTILTCTPLSELDVF